MELNLLLVQKKNFKKHIKKQLTMQVRSRAFGLTFVKPSVTRVSYCSDGKILDRYHSFHNTVIFKGTTYTAMRMEECIVMIHAIGTAEVIVGYIAVIPFSNGVCISMSNMMNILNTIIDSSFQLIRAPCSVFCIMTSKIIVFWDAYRCTIRKNYSNPTRAA